MPLQLKITSEHANLVGDDADREYNETGGTIGRSLHNDWILPDPDRYISGRHATIDFKGGMYYLADISSNGVYINDEVDPIGRGNPRRLFNGDRLRLGDFEIAVAIDSGESLVIPLEADRYAEQDNNEQFVDEVSLRTGIKLLDEEEITGDEEFQSAMFGSESSHAQTKLNLEIDAPPKAAKVVEKQEEQSAATASVDVTAEDLFDSFLDGLGISRVELHPSVNRPDMLLTAGQVLREFVKGTTEMLTGRANLKNTFRLDQTSVLPRHNNPMKFSDNTTDLLKQLLVGGEGEYLGAKDSIHEVLRDLINHQNAFLDAMNSAFVEFADRLDPDELQQGFDRTMGRQMFGFMRQMKYWNLYSELYPIITEKGGSRFPQMFGEEFVRAYERQVAEYRRHDREGTAASGLHEVVDQTPGHDLEPDLMKTQKLEQSPFDEDGNAFVEDDVIDALSNTGARETDQSFIDTLDDEITSGLTPDQRKAF